MKVTKHNRLAIITLHRGQHYESFDNVQKELTDIICSLTPSSLTSKKVSEMHIFQVAKQIFHIPKAISVCVCVSNFIFSCSKGKEIGAFIS